MVPGENGVLIGLVNIHTHQAELLMEHFAELRGAHHDEELTASRDPRRLPHGARRLQRGDPAARRERGRRLDDA